jgi:NADH-quinone oxidoreductase subunit G
MSQDKITIKVNEVDVEARPGEMLIEATDRAGIYVPRFCYHPKLSIAANCRMCLVEVARAPKPLPACATPVTPGMEVHTRSAKAIAAQKATMEFLLINHPLDCPICDQGGECELQDLAMGYGRDISRFNERKRIVRDKDIGPLVSTDMTRCIHCTRCVRFGTEVAGIQELGTIGRGDRMQISTFIEQSVDHELSGNIIDLCPVGALNSKPYRFSARAWEMVARPTIAPHDCLGSHLSAHVLNGRIKRVVPQPCESLNETWLSDRDRFSYEGIYAGDRLKSPMYRDNGEWREVGWDEALQLAAAGLQRVVGTHGGDALGAWVSPTATTEEGWLLQSILRRLGSSNIDHRLRRRDFRDAASEPVLPLLGVSVAELESRSAILVIGSELRQEVPLLAHRVRKAALRGARVMWLAPERQELLFPLAASLSTGPALVEGLRAVVRAAAGDRVLPADIDWNGVSVEPAHRAMAAGLAQEPGALVLVGLQAGRDSRYAEIRALAGLLGELTGAAVGFLSEGPNSAGLSLAGVLPDRGPGASAQSAAGRDLGAMIAAPPRGLVLWNAEPDLDCVEGAEKAASAADFVLAFSPWFGDSLRRVATLVLPIGTWAETAGTFVNAEGRWQRFAGVATPVADARPGWKVLRVLGNVLGLPGYDWQDADELAASVAQAIEGAAAATPAAADWQALARPAPAAGAALPVGMYATDALVRRAQALQLAAGRAPGADVLWRTA